MNLFMRKVWFMKEILKSRIEIGVIGDYDGRPSHIATNEAIRHCALYLGLKQETQWISTKSLEDGCTQN